MNSTSQRILVTTAVFLAATFSASAQSGTWTNLTVGNASGKWTTATNWSGSVVAAGSGNTADFNTLNITVDSTITLDAPVTVGNLIFGDTTTGSAAGWTLGNGGNTNNALTLAGTTPTVTVNALGTGKSVTFDAQVLGTSGLIKSGTGRLVLNNSSNAYTGTISTVSNTVTQFGSPTFSTFVQRGRLVLGSATAAGTGNILVQETGGTASLDLSGNTVANNIAMQNDSYLYNGNTSTAATLNGDLWLRGYARIGSATTADGTGTVIVNGKVVFFNAADRLFTGVGGTLTVLNGTVSHANSNGIIIVGGGTLRANDGANIATNSTLRLGFATGNVGGIFETSSNITRSIGDAAGLISVGHGGTTNTNIGFSAFGAPITVALGGTSAPTALTWGAANFLAGSSNMVLNAATANNTLTFANAIDLNASTRTITVDAQTAIISGNLSNGSGTAGLTKSGVGTLVLSGTNTYNGDTTISAGVLRGTVSSVPGNVVNNAAFVLDEAATNAFGGAISGSGTFEKVGAGTLTLSASNSYSGTTTVAQGVLRLNATNALGTTNVGTTVLTGSTLDLNARTITGEVITINGTGVGGNGALVNNGSGTANGVRLLLTNAASVGGTARMDTAFAFTVINGGTNTLTKVGTNQFTINSGTVTIGQINVDQGDLVSVNSAVSLGSTNFGTAVASGASLQFFNNTVSAITNSENITLANNAELAGTSTNISQLNGTVSLTSGTAKLRVEATGASTLQLGGVVTGAGGLNKISGGTLTLSGAAANDYAGATIITGGTVNLSKSAGTTAIAGDITVNATAKLLLSASDQVADTSAVTLSGGTIERASGVTETFGDLELTAASFINFGTGATSSLNFGIYTGGGFKLNVSNFLEGNVLTFGNDLSGSINNSSLFGFDNGFTSNWNGSTFTITAIPEPSTVLAALGLAGLMLWPASRRLRGRFRARD